MEILGSGVVFCTIKLKYIPTHQSNLNLKFKLFEIGDDAKILSYVNFINCRIPKVFFFGG